MTRKIKVESNNFYTGDIMEKRFVFWEENKLKLYSINIL